MKRITLASLLAATCLISSAVSAQQPETVMREFLIESSESELCSSIREQLPGTVAACRKQVREELEKRGYKNPRRVPDRTRVLVEVRADTQNFTTQTSPSASIPPINRLDLNQTYNRLSVEMQARDEKLDTRLSALEGGIASANAGISRVEEVVQTFAGRPSSGAQFPAWLMWTLVATAGGVGFLVLLALFSVVRNDNRKLREMRALYDVDSKEERAALQTLGKAAGRRETLISELMGARDDLDHANKRTAELEAALDREAAEAAKAKKTLAEANAALSAARASGKASEAEIRRLEGVAEAARKEAAKEEAEREAAEQKLAEAAKSVGTALKSERQATAQAAKADAALQDVADKLELSGAEKK